MKPFKFVIAAAILLASSTAKAGTWMPVYTRFSDQDPSQTTLRLEIDMASIVDRNQSTYANARYWNMDKNTSGTIRIYSAHCNKGLIREGDRYPDKKIGREWWSEAHIKNGDRFKLSRDIYKRIGQNHDEHVAFTKENDRILTAIFDILCNGTNAWSF
jgi:hypothetical protein